MMASLLAFVLLAAPNFVTPEMTYRRGLTDEQYDHLWKMGRNPKIEPSAAREWMFKSYRFGNTTNWLNIVGQTNDFAKLSYVLQDENFKLEETNSVIVAENDRLWTTNAIIVAENEILVETNAVLEVDAKKAKKVEKAAAKAKKKDQKNFEKWVSDTEKAKKKSSEDMAEFYDSVLEISKAYEQL